MNFTTSSIPITDIHKYVSVKYKVKTVKKIAYKTLDL